MKDLLSRLIHEEEASLDMWITVIIFLLITVAAYIIIWKKFGKDATVQSVNKVGSSMKEILSDADTAGVTAPTIGQ